MVIRIVHAQPPIRQNLIITSLMKEVPEVPSIPRLRRIGTYVFWDNARLGRVGSAAVFEGRHMYTGCPVVLKLVHKTGITSVEDVTMLVRDIRITKTMDHPFIIGLLDLLDDADYYYLIFEHVSGGTLFDYIIRNGRLREIEVQRIFTQLISAVQCIHEEHNDAHPDIRAESILLDEMRNVRIADFGLSRRLANGKGEGVLVTPCWTAGYASPEILEGKVHTAATDIWSLGVLLYVMIVGKLPFRANSFDELCNMICFMDPDIPDAVSSPFRNLLRRMLSKDPAKRPVCSEIARDLALGRFRGALRSGMAGMRATSMDQGIFQELEHLGYDTGGLEQELRHFLINERTASFKMLKRRKTIEELGSLCRVAAPKPTGI